MPQQLKILHSLFCHITAKDILPSKHKVAEAMKTSVSKSRITISRILKAKLERSGVGITTDIWTDDFHRNSYLSMTLHWIENNQVQEAAMAFSVLPPISKTATVVSRYLIDNFKKVDAYTAGRLRRIIFTTDQGSNILSAFKDSGFVVAIEDIDIRPEILQSTRISCSSNILNNVLTKLFKPSELKIHYLSLHDLLHNCYIYYIRKSSTPLPSLFLTTFCLHFLPLLTQQPLLRIMKLNNIVELKLWHQMFKI